MTVSSLTQKISYDGDGTATALPVPFQFWDETDLYVYQLNLTTGFESLLLLGVDYTVTGGDGSSGTVVPAAVRALTVRWTILRGTSILQTHDYQTHDPFPSQSHEDALDRVTEIAQDLSEKVDRGLKTPVTDPPWVGQLPSLAERAGKGLLFDLAGEPTVGELADPGLLVVTPFVQTILDDADDTAVRLTIDAQEDVLTTRGDMVRGGVGGVAERFAKGSNGQYLRYNSLDATADTPQLPDFNLYFQFKGMLFGGELSNNGAAPTTTIDISAFCLRDSTNAVFVQSVGGLSKLLSTTWVVGTGNGGRATAAALANDTWYHVFAIMTSNAYGTVDVGFDTSLTAANLLSESGYTYYRRIGSVKTATGSTSIVTFVQDGDEFLFKDPPLDIDVTQGTTATLYPLTVPPGVKVRATVNFWASHGTGAVHNLYINSPDANSENPSSTAAPLANIVLLADGGAGAAGGGQITVRTDTSRQIRVDSGSSSVTLRGSTIGYFDSRGRNA